MKRKQIKKQVYIKPTINVVVMPQEHLLQAASGQHGHIGGGGSFGNAKSNTNYDEWEEEEGEIDQPLTRERNGYSLWRNKNRPLPQREQNHSNY